MIYQIAEGRERERHSKSSFAIAHDRRAAPNNLRLDRRALARRLRAAR